MRILYLSQYFHPEAGATQNRALEMASNWVRMGHEVTVICEIPNHPAGIIPPKYRGKFMERTSFQGIDVIHVWVKTSPTKTFRSRMLFYISFMLTSALSGLFLINKKFDLVYTTSPPLFVGASGLIMSRIKRIPFFFEVRDIWPESAIALGELKNPSYISLARRLETTCYESAKKIFVVTEGIYNKLRDQGIAQEKIVHIPNGANIDKFHYQPELRRKIREELLLDCKFCVIYAGIHGIAQRLETIIEAARLLESDTDVCFLLIGEGPERNKIIELVKNYSLRNVILLPEQPVDAMPGYLSAADIAIIPLRNLDIFRGALPSKLFDSWACQLPVLLSVDGEARQIMDRANAGIYVPPEDPQALCNAILFIKDDDEKKKTMGINGRNYTEKHFSRKDLAEKLAGIIASSLEGSANHTD